eukprot:CAMPEP_0119023092 /NCGR_PEP_ID=MMETSP1176-20130426/29302_1 /TAXON_ID=265551 /ORGANISM="Synedropsis recta cf, Strain CCMP1620" /LENGTH=96 /DNA_ID=CAMNT_0006978081 /DNA_START=33 /DNA_END=320 /DNA_ORIENTATION=-
MTDQAEESCESSSPSAELLPSFDAEQASTLHPLHILDIALKDLESKKNLEPDQKQDEMLRAADFLLGGSMLDGALSVLDSPAATIRHLCSPHRSAH